MELRSDLGLTDGTVDSDIFAALDVENWRFSEFLAVAMKWDQLQFTLSDFYRETCSWAASEGIDCASCPAPTLSIRGHLLIAGPGSHYDMASSYREVVKTPLGAPKDMLRTVKEYRMIFVFFMWLTDFDWNWLRWLQPAQDALWLDPPAATSPWCGRWYSVFDISVIRTNAEDAHEDMLEQLTGLLSTLQLGCHLRSWTPLQSTASSAVLGDRVPDTNSMDASRQRQCQGQRSSLYPPTPKGPQELSPLSASPNMGVSPDITGQAGISDSLALDALAALHVWAGSSQGYEFYLLHRRDPATV